MLSIDAWLDEKPYKELFDGVVHEKVSPQRGHGEIMLNVGILLKAWGGDRGSVAMELRAYLGEGVTLVPDVAYVSGERLARLSAEEQERPPFAPDIVVEVRSPEDRELRIRRKTELYLAHGATLVLNVDPATRTIRVTDVHGEAIFRARETIEHAGFPGLQIPVDDVFASLDRKW
ncbi:MAG TPA: Uma2 family endonuclease [Candidatus Baltobacteraceae bacterium]|jgi:Uma2 family endonuclease